MQTVYLGLGSNMGDRAGFLRRALAALEPRVRLKSRSRVYESRAMYVAGQPDFLNMVVEGVTDLAPHQLLTHLKGIEASFGRMPDTHNQPRPIDLDILLYGDVVLVSDDLTIPHPRLHERPFAVVPLSEIAALVVHPVSKRAVIDLEAALGQWGDDMWEADERV